MKCSRLTGYILSFLALSGWTNVNAQIDGELHVASPEWREQIIYFVMIDRFNDGNPGNNNQVKPLDTIERLAATSRGYKIK